MCDPFSVVIFDHTIFVLNMLTYQTMIGSILFPNLQFQTIPDETFVPAASVCGPDAMGTFPALIVCSDLVLSSLLGVSPPCILPYTLDQCPQQHSFLPDHAANVLHIQTTLTQ